MSLSPINKGIGIGTTLMVIYCNLYYIVVMAWAIHFLGSSLLALLDQSEDAALPWAKCGQWWNSPGCVSVASNDTSSVVVAQQQGEVNYTDSAVEYWE